MANSITNSWYSTTPVIGTSGAYNIASSNINASTDCALVVSDGQMSVTVPLDVNGIDVEQVLKDLMLVTGVVARNRKLEKRYSGLKKIGEHYQETLQNLQIDVNIKIKEAADQYRFAEEKYNTLEMIKGSK
jgi:hypothetical protein